MKDKTFEECKARIDAFKDDLKALAKKYNLGVHESDNYNGNEEYCGATYYFIVDGDMWAGQDAFDILAETLGIAK